jgi:hypothetical protein
MTQPAKSQEPSMEEILASIRRIIADDDASKPAAAEAEPPPAAAAPVVPPPRPAMPPRPQAVPPPMPTAPQPSTVSSKSPSGGAAAAAGSSSRSAIAEQSADIFDLTESMAAPPPSAPPPFRTIDGGFDVGYDEARDKPAVAQRAGDIRSDDVRLLSRETTAAVDSAFNSLAQTVLMQNARTLEDLVREMLRPLLKSWLDDNLPALVERMVRSEIERVSRGRPS